jgi:hypothetical protein
MSIGNQEIFGSFVIVILLLTILCKMGSARIEAFVKYPEGWAVYTVAQQLGIRPQPLRLERLSSSGSSQR